jgi:ribonuclease PH
LIGAVSVGVWKGQAVLDLDYAEDSTADTDMNVVVAEGGGLIEVQGTAEGAAFERTELNSMLDLAVAGGQIIINKQREALSV